MWLLTKQHKLDTVDTGSEKLCQYVPLPVPSTSETMYPYSRNEIPHTRNHVPGFEIWVHNFEGTRSHYPGWHNGNWPYPLNQWTKRRCPLTPSVHVTGSSNEKQIHNPQIMTSWFYWLSYSTDSVKWPASLFAQSTYALQHSIITTNPATWRTIYTLQPYRV